MRIREAMLKCNRYNIIARNSAYIEKVHHILCARMMALKVIPNLKDLSTLVLNTRFARVLSLAAVSLLLLLAKGIYKAKVKPKHASIANP